MGGYTVLVLVGLFLLMLIFVCFSIVQAGAMTQAMSRL